MRTSEIVEQQVVMLLNEKSSYREIQKMLGVGLSTINRVAKRNNLIAETSSSQDKPEGGEVKEKFSLLESIAQINDKLGKIERLLEQKNIGE